MPSIALGQILCLSRKQVLTRSRLDQVLTRFKSLDARYRVLHNLLSDYSSAAHDDVDRRFLDDWVFHQVEKALSSLGKCCAQDAHAMTGIGERYGAEFLIQRYSKS